MALLRVVPAARSGETDASLETLLLECGFVEIRAESSRTRETWLDTHDGRLWERGMRLWFEAPALRWRLRTEAGERFEQPGGLDDVPARGPVGKLLAPAAGKRRCIPLLTVLRERRRYRIPGNDASGPVVFETEDLTWIDPVSREETSGPRVLVIDGTAEDRRRAETLHFLLTRLPGGAAETFDPLSEGLRAQGRFEPGPPALPGDRIRPRDSLEAALGRVLERQARVLESLRWGTVHDLDPEFLHRMRVATRRTRAALRLFEDIVPRPRGRTVRRELSRFADVLGGVRDLDVLLGELPWYLREAGADPETGARIEAAFRARRSAAREGVVDALNDTLFPRLVEAVRACVPPREGEETAEEAAPRLVARALRRMKKRARFPDPPSEEDLHRLRIAGKRLRYVTEFFADIEPDRARKPIRKLVRYQDDLGSIQDARVFQKACGDLARSWCAEPRTDPGAVLVLGRMQAVAGRRIRRVRRRFRKRWKTFDRTADRLLRSFPA